MKITSDFRNDLLKRREVGFVMDSGSNPGLEEVREMVASEMKSDGERIIVKALRSNFGSGEFLIEALVYDTLEDRERIEPKKKVKNGKN